MTSRQIVAAVFSNARRLIEAEVEAEPYRALLLHALSVFRGKLREDDLYHFIHLPVAVDAAIREGGGEKAIPLSAATTLAFAGFDIVDDLADDDTPPLWLGYSAAERNLAAAALFSMLPQLAILRLEVSAEAREQVQRDLASSFITIAAGQLEDVRVDPATIRSVELERIIAGKTAAQPALFARLAARLAGADEGVIQIWGELGEAIGFAAQIASDFHELMSDPDPRAGWRGPNIVAALFRQRADDEKLRLAELAAEEETAAESLRRVLRESAALRLAAFDTEVHCRKAVRLLDQLPCAGDDRLLREIIGSLSFFK